MVRTDKLLAFRLAWHRHRRQLIRSRFLRVHRRSHGGSEQHATDAKLLQHSIRSLSLYQASTHHRMGRDARCGLLCQVTFVAQFLAVWSASIRAETLGYAVSFASPWRGEHRFLEWHKPAFMDQLQPATNADKL